MTSLESAGSVLRPHQPIGLGAPEFLIDPARRRGRGALTKKSGRFEPHAREDVDDGWGSLESLQGLKTHIHLEKARSVVTKNDSPDIAFDRSVNPYRGCEHGCVYCYARRRP